MFIIFIIISLVLPPAAVAIRRGFGTEFLLNLLLTLLFWLPGAIHALYVVFKSDGTKSIA
ncbi:YqaE/Pmp3 family membrane protein [Synoicihabitans lomoniglobus]|uniref:YqaE/Pmp3 family membrane protein n=1 Tax=Synoicihabitans lomoniglobus TaxID=2909285 RepID=A0AAE9ZSF9_9BACT|nr:YqaE/Pmp3 family membrane protein [Opitutaceae bacterium LMO-M01]WED63342.1 YqaE/Pmp3 family membrane protein [Opitutaceae bacterium LMO-M01]